MRSLARLNHYFKQYWRLFVPGLLLTMLSAIFSITVPMVVRQAVDSISRFVGLYHQFEGTDVQNAFFSDLAWTFLVFGLIIIGLSLASGLCSFLMRQTVIVASRHIEFDLRNKLYSHLQKLSDNFYNRTATGDVITRATSDVEQVRRYIGPAIMYMTRALVIVVTAITVMLIISPRLTMYALLPMPLLGVAIFIVSQLIHKRSDALQSQYSRLTSRVQEALSGIRVLKAYAREESEAKAFESESGRYKNRMLSLAKAEASWRPVFVTVVGLSQILVVWIGGRLVVDGLITVGNIAEYIIYIRLMTWPVAALGMVISMMQRASASIERIHGVLDTQPAIADDDTTNHTLHSIEGHITFDNVSFRYADNLPWALKDISFDLPPGDTLAVVGRTGSGKTTLVNLICRLMDPTSGRLLMDGRDLSDLPLEVLRKNIGYVPQEVFLFSESVGENIAFGTIDAEQDAIERAAHESELLDNVLDFPEGFGTFVGERGVTLSGGQKQRTTIARALIRNPRLLILDDSLSSVDTNTESRILHHMRLRYGRQTFIMVSHRISSVQDADLILVLDQGALIERGRHEDLVHSNGLYAQLYERQLLEAELEAM